VHRCVFYFICIVSAVFHIMSKLGLNRGKMVVNSAKGTVAQEPPDKRQKMDIDTGSAAAEAWDDDLDVILTQNMNQLDNLVASSCQPAVSNVNMSTDTTEQPGVSSVLANGGSKTLAFSAVSSALPARSRMGNAGYSTVSEGCNGRLVGRGSAHSRSADFVSICSAPSMQPATIAGSVAGVEQGKGGKNSFSASVRANSSVRVPVTVSMAARAGSSSESGGVDVSRMVEECDYYKTQVILWNGFVVFNILFRSKL
jgi:hypothetical protein